MPRSSASSTASDDGPPTATSTGQPATAAFCTSSNESRPLTQRSELASGNRPSYGEWPADGIADVVVSFGTDQVFGWRGLGGSTFAPAILTASDGIRNVPYVALAAIAIAYARTPSTPHPFQNDLPCAITTLLLAGVVGGALVVARRATEPVRPRLKALLLSTFAAAVAAVLVFLACPLEDARHFALAHLGGALIAGTLLAGLASRIIRV